MRPCTCGHGLEGHKWDRTRYRYCQVCVVCGRHPGLKCGGAWHIYKRCRCNQYQEA